jgi:hypothetical protein
VDDAKLENLVSYSLPLALHETTVCQLFAYFAMDTCMKLQITVQEITTSKAVFSFKDFSFLGWV